jgi:hypothetical protein
MSDVSWRGGVCGGAACAWCRGTGGCTQPDSTPQLHGWLSKMHTMPQARALPDAFVCSRWSCWCGLQDEIAKIRKPKWTDRRCVCTVCVTRQRTAWGNTRESCGCRIVQCCQCVLSPLQATSPWPLQTEGFRVTHVARRAHALQRRTTTCVTLNSFGLQRPC